MNRRIRQVIGPRVVKAVESTTVSEAARLMKEANVGAVMVVRKDRLVGIFTERDAIVRVLAEGRDPLHTRLSQVMTASPMTLSPEKPFGHALVLMHEHGFRHVPVVEDGHPVGMVSIRDARLPELGELEADLEEREHIAEVMR